ncbi:uncharacterized protein LOC130975623 [Arachis stenosperma]|uniref:uncharacterized protein LOC130975623 n=1 Tax=Arachis stenosperma TaxID=217475 RepID=UPI0025ACD93E|nr:uncharacterized protein LOC130975623 [Arachis stenosperma]
MVIVNGVASRTRSKKKNRSLNPSPIGSGSRNVFPIDGAGTSANDPIIVGLIDSSSDEGTDNIDEGRGRSLDWDFGLSSESEDEGEGSASASISSSGSDDDAADEGLQKLHHGYVNEAKKEEVQERNVFPIDGAGTSANDPIIVSLSESISEEGTDNSDEGRGRSLDWDFGLSSESEDEGESSASASTSSSGSDDSGSSSFDDEDEEGENEKRRCKRRKKEKKRREPTFESHSNKVLSCDEVIVETECSGIRKKNGENKNNSSSTENNVFDHQQEKMLPKDADCASVLFRERNMEGCSSEKNEDKEKNVAKKSVEVCSSKKNEDKEENVAMKPVEGCSSEKNDDKKKNVAKKPGEGCSSKKNEDKGNKVAKKPMPAGNRARKRVERTGENVGADIEASSQKRSHPSLPEEDDSEKDEKKSHYPDNVHKQDTISKEPALNVQRKFFVPNKVPIEKTEFEKERDMLWEEMDALLRLGEVDSLVSEYPREGSRKKLLSDGPNGLCFDDAPFGVREGGYCNKEGTVWDLIPADTKQNLYAHQLEGFEFLWKNLVETMELPKLKSCDSNSTGGCIISHAPGTGKTRLTIVFL